MELKKLPIDKYSNEFNSIVNEYRKIHDSLNLLEKEIKDKMNIHTNLNAELNSIREREKELINNIEKETGETISPNYLYSLMLSELKK